MFIECVQSQFKSKNTVEITNFIFLYFQRRFGRKFELREIPKHQLIPQVIAKCRSCKRV